MPTYYVDGKNGNDSNAGTSLPTAFRTIAHAVAQIPTGSTGQGAGYTILVQGYTDYVYRERPIAGGIIISGTSGSPLVIGAIGANAIAGSYLQACVDGSAPVNTASYAGLAWTHVSGTVYKTPWPNALSRNDGKVDYTDTERVDRAWLNSSLATGYSVPLRRPVPAGGAGTALTIADLQGAGFSYFHDRWSAQGAAICSTAPGGSPPLLGTLYVNLAQNSTAVGNPAYPAPASTDPTAGSNLLEMPYQSTLYFDNACNNLTLQGLRAWHSDLGFSFKNGCHDILVQWCDARYNFDMGYACIGSAGQAVTNITITKSTATGNTIQACKCDGVTASVSITSNDFWQNCLQDGVDVVSYQVHDVTISQNKIRDGNALPLYNRYQANGAIAGIVLEDGCYAITISDNDISNQSNGIATYISGAQTRSLGAGALSSVHGGDFTAQIHGNRIHGERHVASDSGFAISFGNPAAGGVDGAADEAAEAIVFTNNWLYDNDGGGVGTNGGAYFAYALTGKTVAPNGGRPVAPQRTLAMTYGLDQPTSYPGTQIDAATALAQGAGVKGSYALVGWNELESTQGVYPGITRPSSGLAAQLAYYQGKGLAPLLTVAALGTVGSVKPAYLGTASYASTLVKQRFHALWDQVAPLLDSTTQYVCIGNEIDAPILAGQVSQTAFKSFLVDAVQYIHQTSPGIQVGATVRYISALGNGRAICVDLLSVLDIWAFTYYPIGGGFQMLPPPRALGDLSAMVGMAGSGGCIKPVIITEIGYPSDPLTGSSEAQQQAFVVDFFSAWAQRAQYIPLAAWFAWADFSPATLAALAGAFGSSNPAFLAYLGTLGLLTNNLVTQKAGWPTFAALGPLVT